MTNEPSWLPYAQQLEEEGMDCTGVSVGMLRVRTGC